MTPDELARLHALCFTRPRPWSRSEFEDLTRSPWNFLLTAPQGFLLGRALAGEAELLTLAVAPCARRGGFGRDLTERFAVTSRQRGATEAFLEVAADNLAAKALYSGLGWREVGRRRRYYAANLDALVMRLEL